MRFRPIAISLSTGFLILSAAVAHANTVDVDIQALNDSGLSPWACIDNPPGCTSGVDGAIQGWVLPGGNACHWPMTCVTRRRPVAGGIPFYYSQFFQNGGYEYMDYKATVDVGQTDAAEVTVRASFTAFAGWSCQKTVTRAVVFLGSRTEVPFKAAIKIGPEDCTPASGGQENGGGSIGLFNPGPIGGMPGGGYQPGGTSAGTSAGGPSGGTQMGGAASMPGHSMGHP